MEDGGDEALARAKEAVAHGDAWTASARAAGSSGTTG